jgi:hypothetical protein
VTLFFLLGTAVAATVAVRCSWPTRTVHSPSQFRSRCNRSRYARSPDAAAAGRAVVAYQMKLSGQDRTRLWEVAVAAMPDDAGSVVAWGLPTSRTGAEYPDSVRPGQRRVCSAAFGTGIVRLTVDLVTTEENPAGQAELTCAPIPTSGSVPATGFDAVNASLIPDSAAIGRTTAVIAIERR